MNLMFRRNLEKGGAGASVGGGGSGGGGGGGFGSGGFGGLQLSSGNNGGFGPEPRALGVRRSRDLAGQPMQHQEQESGAGHAYRTHLLFSAHTGGGPASAEELAERFGPRRTSANPQQLVKWGGSPTNQQQQQGRRKQSQPQLDEQLQHGRQQQTSTPQTLAGQPRQAASCSSRSSSSMQQQQVSFGGRSSQHQQRPIAFTPSRSEPISLAQLDRDCFIIPLASLDRFLPAGVPRVAAAAAAAAAAGASSSDKRRPGSPLSVLEVEDPKQCVLAHFMTSLEPLEPLVEPVGVQPLVLQRDTAAELLSEISPSASQSILLTNMERNADFPFIGYYVLNKQKTEPLEFYQEVQGAALKKFDPRSLRYIANHSLELFNEVATIARPPLEPPGGRPPVPSTGYLVSIFKVFEGDDGLKFEQNWLYWTGARMIYRYLPKSVGLRRITLHKSMSQGDKTYLLICECSQLQENLSAAAILLPALRARLCGYVGLYRPSVCF